MSLKILDRWRKQFLELPVRIGRINEKNFLQLLRNGSDIVAFSDYLRRGKSPYDKFATLVETSRHYKKLPYE